MGQLAQAAASRIDGELSRAIALRNDHYRRTGEDIGLEAAMNRVAGAKQAPKTMEKAMSVWSNSKDGIILRKMYENRGGFEGFLRDVDLKKIDLDNPLMSMKPGGGGPTTYKWENIK